MVWPRRRVPERLQDLVHTFGEAVLPLRLHVTDVDRAARAVAVAVAVRRFDRIDVAVNKAGYSDLGLVEDTTIDAFRAQLETDSYGVVNVIKAPLVPILREQASGHLVQVSSFSARWPPPSLTAYLGAKWAVTGLSLGLAQEIAPFGVQVTVLEPGGMRTDRAGSSLTFPSAESAYEPMIGAFAGLVRATSGCDASDARRPHMWCATWPDTPTRILFGSDAAPLAQQAAQELASVDAAWRDVSLSVADPPDRREDLPA